MKVLARDATIGATAVVTRMDAGAVIPAQFHSQTDEPVYVLEGELNEDGERHGPGGVLHGRGGDAARAALDDGLHTPDALQRRAQLPTHLT